MTNKFTCVFIGRFQPFHTGHMLVVQGMVKVCGKIIIAVCSPSAKQGATDPFTSSERRDMIQRALQANDIIPNADVTFIEISDQPTDEAWAKMILEQAGGTVHQVWTGNEWTKKCFEAAGIEVKWIKEVPGISATEVRKRMAEGGDWKAQVPEEVASSIIAIDGVDRVKKLAGGV